MLRPDWFVSTSKTAKDKLFQIARNGGVRPLADKQELGRHLCRYTNNTSDSYDLLFDKKIRTLRPDWFESIRRGRAIIATGENKRLLMEMAKNKMPRPLQKHSVKLAAALYRYTTKRESCSSYDENFTNYIMRVAPEWMINTRVPTKNKIIDFATKFENKSKLGKYLLGKMYSYCNKKRNIYDCDFHTKIIKLRPDWLVLSSEIVKQNKDKILKVAKSGKPKPKFPDRMASLLINYTHTKQHSYDSVFDKKIRILRPDWFGSIRIRRSKQ